MPVVFVCIGFFAGWSWLREWDALQVAFDALNLSFAMAVESFEMIVTIYPPCQPAESCGPAHRHRPAVHFAQDYPPDAHGDQL